MKNRFLYLSIAVLFVLSCQAISGLQPTPIAPTQPPRQIPTSTDKPRPTVEPSATSIPVPGLVSRTFSGLSPLSRDEFNYIMDNQAPVGWESTDRYSFWITKDDELKIQVTTSGSYGAVFYYAQERINRGEGVYFKFKYSGAQDAFTLGFDAARASGQLIGGDDPDFCSVALEMNGGTLSAHVIDRKVLTNGSLKGNLKLEEGTWYDAAMGMDKDENYIIKIWQPDAPDNQLVFMKNWPGLPKTFYFISWVGARRTLWLDDFTVFKFESIIE